MGLEEEKVGRGKSQPELFCTRKILLRMDSIFKDKKSSIERSSNTSHKRIMLMVLLLKRIIFYGRKKKWFWKSMIKWRRESKSSNRKNCWSKKRSGIISYSLKHKKYQKQIIKNETTPCYFAHQKTDEKLNNPS